MAKRSVGDWIMGRKAKTKKTKVEKDSDGFKVKLDIPELKVEKGDWRGLPSVRGRATASKVDREYINGKWRDTNGRWRDKQGRFTSAPKASKAPKTPPRDSKGRFMSIPEHIKETKRKATEQAMF